MGEEITLTIAAQRLGRRYRSTLDLVLMGKLKGRQDEASRRWMVCAESVEQFRRAQEVA